MMCSTSARNEEVAGAEPSGFGARTSRATRASGGVDGVASGRSAAERAGAVVRAQTGNNRCRRGRLEG